MADAFQKAFDKLEAELKQAEKDADKRKGDCADCKWYQKAGDGVLVDRDAACRAPLVSTFSAHPTTGKLVQRPHKIQDQFGHGGISIPPLCGPERNLWTPRPVPLWWWIALGGLMLLVSWCAI